MAYALKPNTASLDRMTYVEAARHKQKTKHSAVRKALALTLRDTIFCESEQDT